MRIVPRICDRTVIKNRSLYRGTLEIRQSQGFCENNQIRSDAMLLFVTLSHFSTLSSNFRERNHIFPRDNIRKLTSRNYWENFLARYKGGDETHPADPRQSLTVPLYGLENKSILFRAYSRFPFLHSVEIIQVYRFTSNISGSTKTFQAKIVTRTRANPVVERLSRHLSLETVAITHLSGVDTKYPGGWIQSIQFTLIVIERSFVSIPLYCINVNSGQINTV